MEIVLGSLEGTVSEEITLTDSDDVELVTHDTESEETTVIFADGSSETYELHILQVDDVTSVTCGNHESGTTLTDVDWLTVGKEGLNRYEVLDTSHTSYLFPIVKVQP